MRLLRYLMSCIAFCFVFEHGTLMLHAQELASLIVWRLDDTETKTLYELHLLDPATQEDTLVISSSFLFWTSPWIATVDGSRTILVGYEDEEQSLTVLDMPSGQTSKIILGLTSYNPMMSPNGKYIAFEAYGSDSLPDLYLYRFETNELRQLTNTPGQHDGGAIWSPDSQSIAYKAHNTLWVVTLGEDPRQLLAHSNLLLFSWNSDSTSLLVGDESGSRSLVSVTDGQSTPLPLCSSLGKNRYVSFAWHPNGDLTCVIFNPSTTKFEIRLVNVEQAKMVIIGHVTESIGDLAWSQSGDYLLYRYGRMHPKIALSFYHEITHRLSDPTPINAVSAQWKPNPDQ